MGLMNGQTHGFFVMVQRRSADAHKGILIGLRDDEMRAVLGLCKLHLVSPATRSMFS